MTFEKSIAHIALVLAVPVTLIMPDDVIVALPLACTISALWLGPSVIMCVTPASFAVRVAGASVELADVVVERVTAFTTPPGALTWTPGASVT
jgi:hypothetical protein